MTRVSLLALPLVLAVACTGIDEEETVAGEELGSSQAALIQCGTSCSSGYHATSAICSSNCGSCFTGRNNAVTCEPNTSSSFFQCGAQCPVNYHPTTIGCSTTCGSCFPSSPFNNNYAICEFNTATFTQCGGVCPSGYHWVIYVCSSSCPGACYSNSTNSVTCQVN